MFRRKKESWLLSILILPLVHAYGPIYTEGTSITHRNGAYCLFEVENFLIFLLIKMLVFL